jgi:CheY-like chemotaxis protein
VNEHLLYLISSDDGWAGRMDGLMREKGLGRAVRLADGGTALSSYRATLPDVALFDLRQNHRRVEKALAELLEALPRLATGGVIVLGAADPADREALRGEREYFDRIPEAEYLPRSTPEELILERIHALHQRIQTSARILPEAPGIAPAVPAPHTPLGKPVCLVKLLLSSPEQQSVLLSELEDLGAEPLSVDDPGDLTVLPDFLILDGASAERHASFLTRLRRQLPGVRIIQLPDEGDKALRRLSRDISALLHAPVPPGDAGALARQIRERVDGGGVTLAVPILLLVEDEQNIRELTAHYLLLQGYEVYQAEDGEEAMSVFRARQPHLILSDVYMPRMNGFKLLLEVKNWAPDLPMLMMTGYSSAAQVLNSSRYHNVAFLPKPFRLSELGERIRSMLGILQ